MVKNPYDMVLKDQMQTQDSIKKIKIQRDGTMVKEA